MRRRNRVCSKERGRKLSKMSLIRSNRKGQFGLIRSNRKGQFEHMHSIFYTLFTAIMIVFSIVVLTVLSSNMEATPRYNTFNLRYNNVVSRLLYSSKCLATMESYTGELGERYQVYPAMIDVAKTTAGTYRSCLDLNAGKDYNFAIAKLVVKAKSASGGKSAEGRSSSGNESSGADAVSSETYELKYVFGDATSCKTKSWKRTGTYFVIVNEAGVHSRGILRFCMNDI